jgi:hypothetical protein
MKLPQCTSRGRGMHGTPGPGPFFSAASAALGRLAVRRGRDCHGQAGSESARAVSELKALT